MLIRAVIMIQTARKLSSGSTRRERGASTAWVAGYGQGYGGVAMERSVGGEVGEAGALPNVFGRLR